jgi:hypothetical protein
MARFGRAQDCRSGVIKGRKWTTRAGRARVAKDRRLLVERGLPGMARPVNRALILPGRPLWRNRLNTTRLRIEVQRHQPCDRVRADFLAGPALGLEAFGWELSIEHPERREGVDGWSVDRIRPIG